jgi:hypothetical protein
VVTGGIEALVTEPVETGLAYQPPNSFGVSTPIRRIGGRHRLKPTPAMENLLCQVDALASEPVSTGLAYQPPNSFGANHAAHPAHRQPASVETGACHGKSVETG